MDSFLKRSAVLSFAVFSYVAHWAAIAWLICFLGEFGPLPTAGASKPTSLGRGLAIELALLVLFTVPHSVMARAAFKRGLTRWVMQPLRRAVYVLTAAALLLALLWQWRSIPGVVWEAKSLSIVLALRGLYLAAWGFATLGTLPGGHLELFGVRQAWLYYQGKPYVPPEPKGPYWLLRIPHPVMIGYFVAMRTCPRMTASHLVASIFLSAYVGVGTYLMDHCAQES